MTSDRRIELVLKGSRTADGAVDFDALLAFGEAFRRALRALVRSQAGLPAIQAGQPGTEVREASSLRLVGLHAGSAVLELEPVDARLVADPVIGALQSLADGLAGRKQLELPIVEFLRDAVQSLGDHASVGVRVPDRDPVEFDVMRLASLLSPSPPAEQGETRGTVDGWLHAVDIDPDEIRIRDTSGRDWSCHYPEELEPRVRELIGWVVRASGAIQASGTRSRIELQTIERLELPPGVGATGRKPAAAVLADSMAEASITAPQPLSALATDVDVTADDEVAFEEALRAIR